MIDKQFGCHVMLCDDCGDEETADKGISFEDFIAAQKEAGWQIKKIGMNGGAEWHHLCSSCAE